MHRGGDIGGLGRAVARAVLVGLEEAQVGIAIEVGDGVGASARARSPSLAILPQIGVQIAPGLTTETWMPMGASSRRRASLTPSLANCAAE